MVGQDVRRIDEEIRPIILALGIAGEFAQVVFDLALVGPPRKISVGLGEAELRETLHQLRARERFRQENRVRLTLLNLGDQPFPEREGLGVWVVDAEDANTLRDPKQYDVAQACPERRRAWRVEIGIDDVFV